MRRKEEIMRYINTLRDGDQIREIYLCQMKRVAETRNGKPYDNIILQDKTGTINAKIWDPNSQGIADYDEKDFIDITAEVISYNGQLQVNIRQLRVAGEDEYVPADFMPTTENNIEAMYEELMGYVNRMQNKYLKELVEFYFVKDEEFIKKYKMHSAAKKVHHGFAGGLLEHTLSIVKLCEYFTKAYDLFNPDLLYAGAIFHDIGKVKELSPFPDNDYTDDGQLLGHIIIGVEMINDAARTIEGFPHQLLSELKHMVLAHHGELEFGSPKKPAIPEAFGLNLADHADARIQTLRELFKDKEKGQWIGYNRMLETNLRKSTIQ